MGVAIPQVITEDKAGGALVIDGGLRFDSGKSHYINATLGLGNRKTWTISTWIKRSKLTSDNCVFNVSNTGNTEYAYIEFNSDSKIVVESYNGSAYQFSFTTTEVFRDPSAWYHIVLSCDMTQATAAERVKLYVNGRQISITFSQSGTQNQNTVVNTGSGYTHRFGSLYGTTWYYGGSLSNVYLIDGQALDASYFGYTDPLTNTWRPKKFSGSFTSTRNENATLNTSFATSPPTDSTGTTTLTTQNISTQTATTNSFGVTTSTLFSGTTQYSRVLTNATVGSSAPFTIDFIAKFVQSGSSSYFCEFANGNAIIQTANPASSTECLLWGTVSFNMSYGWHSVRVQWDGSRSKVWVDGTLTLNVSNAPGASSGSMTIGAHPTLNTRTFNGEFGPFRLTPTALGEPKSGGLLASDFTNSTTLDNPNSFYLPMDGNTPIGQDMSGKGNNWTPVNFGGTNTIEKATGALPILNTDGGGKVARVGVRTDSNASSLVLALPLVGIKSDFSNAINSGTSNKAITVSGSATGITTISNFYGGSFRFSTTSDNLSIPANSDFAFGTGDFTIEFYALKQSAGMNYEVIAGCASDGNGTNGWVLELSANRGLFFYFKEGGTGTIRTPVSYNFNPNDNVWHHYVLTRSGGGTGTYYLYIDGVQVASGASAGTHNIVCNSQLQICDFAGPGNAAWKGYLQDFRIYKGVAKYTQNFIPASTDPDILADTPSGVSYSSNVVLAPTNEGAVAFDSDGDYLTLTSGTDFQFGSGNFTVEAWIYPNTLSNYDPIIDNGSIAGNNQHDWRLYLGSVGEIWFDAKVGGTDATRNGASGGVSNGVVTKKWQHIAVTRSGNIIYTFLDGVQVLSNSFSSTIDSNYTTAYIGADSMVNGTMYYFDGFISNLHVVKGTALYTSNFTPPTAPITSVANTKLLCCKSNSTATAADVTPGTITANGNAAATNFNPFTVNINTQRGQESGYATWNPLKTGSDMTLSNGNLQATGSSANPSTLGTIGMSSGKWYWEITVAVFANMQIGIGNDAHTVNSYLGGTANSWSMHSNGNKYTNGSSSSYGSSYTTGDVIGVAFDADNGTLTFYKNNISQGIAFSSLTSGPYFPGFSYSDPGSVIQANFGQKPFKFPPPAGFQPLALANTPRPTIVRPDQYVGIVTYSGTGATRSLTTGFKPDLVWIKSRTTTAWHEVFDSVRGPLNHIFTNDTAAEASLANTLISFDSRGFTVGSDAGVNSGTAGWDYVAWAWKAGGNSNTYNINDVGYATASAAGLTAGTITLSGASVNTKSGFGVYTWSGTGANGTIAHGLQKAPKFMMFKGRDTAYNWRVYHTSLGATKALILNLTNTPATSSGYFNDTEPTSTVFTVGTNDEVNGITAGTQRMIAYCWAEIPGFSKFGSYTGNNSTDGPVVITGFRPAFVLIRQARTDATGRDWMIFDNKRSVQYGAGGFNVISTYLYPNYSNVEASAASIDFLSNGFKIRASDSTNNNINSSGQNHIYAAFAEAPSFNLYGGQSNAR